MSATDTAKEKGSAAAAAPTVVPKETEADEVKAATTSEAAEAAPAAVATESTSAEVETTVPAKAEPKAALDALKPATSSGWGFDSFLGNLQKSTQQFQKKIEENLNETRQKLQEMKLQDQLHATAENVQKNLSGVKENVQVNLNKNLDDLDTELEKVENATFGIASQLGSFLKEKAGISLELVSDADAASSERDSEVLFNLPKGLASNRVEAQMHELQTNKQPYLAKFKEDPEEYASFTLSADQEKEKETLLKATKGDTAKLYAALVPSEISDAYFWGYYFSQKKLIVDEEQKRKELLKKSAEDEEEEFNWDDEESDEESKKTKSKAEAKTEAKTDAEATSA